MQKVSQEVLLQTSGLDLQVLTGVGYARCRAIHELYQVKWPVTEQESMPPCDHLVLVNSLL